MKIDFRENFEKIFDFVNTIYIMYILFDNKIYMTKQEKIIEKLLNRPTSLRYNEIEKLFENYKFKIEERKGSHKKITFLENERIYVIVPLHNNDCKDVYKIKLKKIYLLTK